MSDFLNATIGDEGENIPQVFETEVINVYEEKRHILVEKDVFTIQIDVDGKDIEVIYAFVLDDEGDPIKRALPLLIDVDSKGQIKFDSTVAKVLLHYRVSTPKELIRTKIKVVKQESICIIYAFDPEKINEFSLGKLVD